MTTNDDIMSIGEDSPKPTPKPQTQYALRYGSTTKPPQIKSGLTPLTPRLMQPEAPTKAQKTQRTQREKYQRSILQGFTTQELKDLDCIALRRNVRLETVGDIHPVLDKGSWESGEEYDLRDPRGVRSLGGVERWVVGGDERVWRVLRPCLSVCSVWLDRVHEHPWFNTMFNGEVKTVLKARYPVKDYKMTHIQKITAPPPSSPQETFQKASERKTELLNLLRNRVNFKLAFFNGEYDPVDNKTLVEIEEEKRKKSKNKKKKEEDAPEPYHGLTVAGPGSEDRITIYLAVQWFIPLLRDDITDAERLVEQYGIAATIFHELMHSFFYVRYGEPGKPGDDWWDITNEYFYEEEQIAEMGYSAENALFGGISIGKREVVDTWRHGPQLFRIAHFINTWPSRSGWGTSEVLQKPGLEVELSIPVPMSYIENMFSIDYWNVHAKSMGMLQYRPSLEPSAVSWRGAYKKADTWKLVAERPVSKSGLPTWEVAFSNEDSEEAKLFREKQDFQSRGRLLLSMTPQERTTAVNNHRTAMGSLFMSKRTALMRLRDVAVQNVISAVATNKGKKSKKNEIDLKELLDDLLEIHQSMLQILMEIRQVNTNLFDATGSDMFKFNEQLLEYCQSLETKQDVHERIRNTASELVTKLTETQNQIRELGQHHTSLEVPDTDITRARYARDDNEQVQMLKEASIALQTSDEKRCIEICDALIGSLACKDINRIDVVILMGNCRSISRKQRINLLTDARDSITDLIPKNSNDRSAKSIKSKLKEVKQTLKRVEKEKEQPNPVQDPDVMDIDTEDRPELCGKRGVKRRRDDDDDDDGGFEDMRPSKKIGDRTYTIQ